MKGLEKIPSLKELEQAYRVLQGAVLPLGHVSESVTEEEFVRFSQWVRFDPRLGEIWIERFSREWKNLRPIWIREALHRAPWPEAFGVLVDQAIAYGGLKKEEKKNLRLIAEVILSGVEPASYENFFIGIHAFSSSAQRLDAEGPLRSYLKWGYFGREVLVNKAQKKAETGEIGRTEISPPCRKKILTELSKKKQRLVLRDYLEALDWKVSRRVAQKDLQSEPSLIPRGNSRARFYVRRRA